MTAKPGGLKLVVATDVQDIPLKWFLPNLVADRLMNGLVGAEGMGKTRVACALAAQATQEERTVVYISAEDGAGRLRAIFKETGGDLSRLHLQSTDSQWTLSSPSELLKELQRLRASFVVLDSLYSLWNGRVDAHRHAEVAALLTPYARMAESHGICILALHHLNKSEAFESRLRVSGSTGFRATFRHACLLAADPADEKLRVLVPEKSNVGDDTASGRRLQVVPFQWMGETKLRAAELVPRSPDEVRNNRDIDQWLTSYLADGSKPAREVFADGKRLGFGEWPIRRAQTRLGIRASKAAGSMNGGWQWSLPDVEIAEDCRSAQPLPSPIFNDCHDDCGRLLDIETTDFGSSLEQ